MFCCTYVNYARRVRKDASLTVRFTRRVQPWTVLVSASIVTASKGDNSACDRSVRWPSRAVRPCTRSTLVARSNIIVRRYKCQKKLYYNIEIIYIIILALGEFHLQVTKWIASYVYYFCLHSCVSFMLFYNFILVLYIL